MSDHYPLYPALSEEAAKEAQQLIDSFKAAMEKAAKEVLSNLYTDVAAYIETDSWCNFRNQLLDGFRNYNNRKVQAAYDFAELRKAIFDEFRDEIIKDLNGDLVEENKQLKEQIEQMIEDRRRYL